MLPFLKERHEGGTSGPVDSIKRDHDEGADYDMLDAIVEDLLEGIHSKDKLLLRGALESLITHIQDLDESQDLSQR